MVKEEYLTKYSKKSDSFIISFYYNSKIMKYKMLKNSKTSITELLITLDI